MSGLAAASEVGPGRRRGVALLVLAAAAWGAGTVISKQAVAELPPVTLLAVQLLVSVIAMSIVLRVRGERWPRGREGTLLGRLGLLNPGFAYALSLLGLTQITASLSVLLWATEPILILALAAVVLGDRAGRPIVGASAAAIGGLGLVLADPGAGGSLVGVALTVAGVVACAVYTVATRRWLLGSDSTFGVVLAQQVHALAFSGALLVLVGLVGLPILPGTMSPAGVASAITSGLLYYALAYSCYLTALRTQRASVAAASFYLIPVFGLAGGWLIGERLEPGQLLGAVIVICAVAAITIRIAQPSSAAASTQIPITPSAASRS